MQNNQKELEIGQIYDQLSGKYVWSCLMTEYYFDPRYIFSIPLSGDFMG